MQTFSYSLGAEIDIVALTRLECVGPDLVGDRLLRPSV